MTSSKIVERELPLIQRGIIDNCFEEGQYEYGIDVLDKLRSHSYKPAPLHIRQLLYLSLYPPPPKLSKTIDGPSSPQRIPMQQRQREDVWPKPTSRSPAITLLRTFVVTNSPTSLMRGLPHYSYVNAEGVQDVDPFKDEDMSRICHEDNSPLRTELQAFDSLNDIWGVLQEGFIKRNGHQRSQEVDLAKEMPSNAVGQYAWPVLELLVRIFEKDEQLTPEGSPVRYSPLLLVQIPPPKLRQGPRWDTEVVVQIIRACFSKVNLEDVADEYPSFEIRCDLGMHLLTMLVNLTLTNPPLVSPSHLARSLSSFLLEMPFDSLQAFFSHIPSCQARFKILLLENYLSSSTSGSKNEPKAVPRARPKPIMKPTCEDSAGSATAKDRRGPAYPAISQGTLLLLLSNNLCSAVRSKRMAVALGKFHLLSALYTLAAAGQLKGWETAWFDGILRKCTLEGYMLPTDATEEEIKEIEDYRASALKVLQSWEYLFDK